MIISKNAVIPNVYTKEEVDQKIAEGGGGTVPDPLNINKLTASVVHANSELQALKCTITGRFISLGDVTAPNLYTKTEVDEKINGSFGSKLSVNTYEKAESSITGDYNAMLTIGGNQTVTTVTGGRTTGVLGCGGAVNYATIASGADNCGVAFVGGTNCNVTMGASRSGLLIVGGGGNDYVMSALYDSMIVCGPDNGVKLKWTHSTSTASLMMNGKTVNVQYSQTITHEAPFTGEATDYAIGDPVFASGRVCKWKTSNDEDGRSTGGEWTYTTTAMDCICEVKPEGQLSEFVGVCVAFVGSDGTYKNEPDGDTNSHHARLQHIN